MNHKPVQLTNVVLLIDGAGLRSGMEFSIPIFSILVTPQLVSKDIPVNSSRSKTDLQAFVEKYRLRC